MKVEDDAASGREQELSRLAVEVRYHEAAYRRGEPEISDASFDELFERYQGLADVLGLAPLERLDARPGAEHTDGFATVEHRVAMLSLEKISPNRRDKDGQPMPLEAQLAAWYRRRREELELSEGEALPLVVEPKIDGISASLLYEEGRLVRAVTRGDGRKGDVITEQVLSARAVPAELSVARGGSMEVRGEIYWPRAAFDAHNARLGASGERQLINPRNGTAGMMKRKSHKGLDEAGIRSFLYQVAWSEGVTLPEQQSELLRWLGEGGAEVYLSEVYVAADAESAFAYCEGYGERRGALGYDIDGMVIKVDELAHYSALGGTGHHPHWGIAYKFPPERKATLLEGISVQVGKSGKLTPVAELTPVFVAGTTVSRASLHNFAELQRKDIRVGDRVFVEKAGEIIPQVVGVLLDARPADASPFPRPVVCPTCGSAVREEEIFIYCPNPSCPDQVRERLSHFASRGAMDIDGLGTALVEQLVASLEIATPDELFSLTASRLEGLERMGKKSAENIERALEVAKGRGLAKVLVGLAIAHVGETMSEDLARYFKSADALLEFATRYVAGEEEAVQAVAPEKSTERGAIEGLAKKSADSIFAELDSPSLRAIFTGLREAGVRLTALEDSRVEVLGVAGKTFVLTGTLPSMKRSEAASLLKAAGGKVSSSVSKKTDFIVAGDEAGSKLEKALKLGVSVVDQATLMEMLGEG